MKKGGSKLKTPMKTEPKMSKPSVNSGATRSQTAPNQKTLGPRV